MERKGSFNLIHQASGVKVDVLLCKPTEFYASELQRRRKVLLAPDFETYVASPEDVILKKLDYFREGGSPKHLADIGQMLAGATIDETYLEVWVKKFGLQDEWARARRA